MQFNRHFINRIEKKDVLRLLLALVAVFVIGVPVSYTHLRAHET